MSSISSFNMNPIHLFANPIQNASKLSSKLPIVIRLLRQQWNDFTEKVIEELGILPRYLREEVEQAGEQEKVVKALASKTFCPYQKLSWKKECQGHIYDLNDRLERGSEIDRVIRSFSKKLCANPDIYSDQTYGERLPQTLNRFTARFHISHHSNTKSCQSAPQVDYSLNPAMSLLEIIEQFDHIIQKNHLSMKREYEILFSQIISH